MMIPFTIRLLDENLWSKFKENENEMIITRCGRCLFPLLKIEIYPTQADIPSIYDIRVNLLEMGNNRWKYRNSSWNSQPHQKGELPSPFPSYGSPPVCQSYRLPVPLKPETFLKDGKYIASFDAIKLSNIESNKKNSFLVKSFKKYQLSITIKDRFNALNFMEEILPLTTFIAVTHYQNPIITSLKKYHNPHAKGTIRTTKSPISWDSIQYVDVDVENCIEDSENEEEQEIMDVEDVDAAFILERFKKQKK